MLTSKELISICKRFCKSSSQSLESARDGLKKASNDEEKRMWEQDVVWFENELDFYESLVNELEMSDSLYDKISEYEKKQPYRTEVTIKIGFDDLSEYEKFEKWLENKRRKVFK